MKKIIITGICAVILIFILRIILGNDVNQNSRIIILDKDNQEIMYLINNHKTHQEKLSMLDEQKINFILAIEDEEFYKHKGFSIKRIIKVSWTNIFSKEDYGASTITQQYIKNVYLNNDKTLSRKVKEIILANKIEKQMTKDEILSEYLASLYFGSNVYGLTNAANYYFSKQVYQLTNQEIVALIALWNAPSIYSNNLNSWNNKKNIYAERIRKLELINDLEYQQIIKPIKLKINSNYFNSNRMFFCDQVLNEYRSTPLKGKFGKLVTIKTNYNQLTEQINPKVIINYSIIASDLNGYITCCIGNNDYNLSAYNVAINGKRDIGSTIKPLLYYEAIKCGYENKTYSSAPYSFTYQDEIVTVTNSSNLYLGDNISMRTALATSDNIYAIKTHLCLGMKTLNQHLKRYDINAAPLPSLALGSVGMPLKKLMDIYSQFFSNGTYQTTRFIKNVTLNEKNINFEVKQRNVNEKEIIMKVKELLDAPFDQSINHATASSLTPLLKNKCYGKSGLTDYDSYMIGFTNKNLVAVWCGDIENKPLTNMNDKKLPKKLFVEAMTCLETK